MSHINLLPWREEIRIVKNRIFFAVLGFSAVITLLVIFILQSFLQYRIDTENANIDFLNNELKSIGNEVTQIKGLQENKKQLLDRMRVIQELQLDRISIVKLFNALPKVVPEGVYLTQLTRVEIDPRESTGAIVQTGQAGSTAQPKKETEISRAKEYRVVMEGVAQSNGNISVLLKNVENIPWLQDVKLSEVSIDKKGQGLDFKIHFIQKIIGNE